jgi:hypothetical protein
MLVAGGTPAELPRYFRESDDDRLRAIMSCHPGRLSQVEWQDVANTFGCGVSVRQIQERWYNFARPGLDRRPFSIEERRQVAELAIGRPHDWKWISTQIGDGSNRSAAMVKHCGLNILPKLAQLGFDCHTAADVACVPDAVFARGIPRGALAAELLAQYRSAQAAVRGRNPVQLPSILEVDNLLARPVTK